MYNFKRQCGCEITVADRGDMAHKWVAEWINHCSPGSSTTPRQQIYQLIDAERDRQDAKWGAQRQQSPLAILAEEVGEVVKAILERQPIKEVFGEIVQVAAVTVCWMEAFTEEEAEA